MNRLLPLLFIINSIMGLVLSGHDIYVKFNLFDAFLIGLHSAVLIGLIIQLAIRLYKHEGKV